MSMVNQNLPPSMTALTWALMLPLYPQQLHRLGCDLQAFFKANNIRLSVCGSLVQLSDAPYFGEKGPIGHIAIKRGINPIYLAIAESGYRNGMYFAPIVCAGCIQYARKYQFQKDQAARTGGDMSIHLTSYNIASMDYDEDDALYLPYHMVPGVFEELARLYLKLFPGGRTQFPINRLQGQLCMRLGASRTSPVARVWITWPPDQRRGRPGFKPKCAIQDIANEVMADFNYDASSSFDMSPHWPPRYFAWFNRYRELGQTGTITTASTPKRAATPRPARGSRKRPKIVHGQIEDEKMDE